mgnify:CR=1 FL=1|jgi:hypothetical protein
MYTFAPKQISSLVQIRLRDDPDPQRLIETRKNAEAFLVQMPIERYNRLRADIFLVQHFNLGVKLNVFFTGLHVAQENESEFFGEVFKNSKYLPASS